MQKLSLNLLRKRLRNYPHLNELENFLNSINKTQLKLIMVFGSLAKGTYTQYSDIDLLCVFDKSFKTMKERFFEAYKYSEGLIQPKSISYNELEKGLKEGNSFLHSIFTHGIILYSKIPIEMLLSWKNEGEKKVNVEYYYPK